MAVTTMTEVMTAEEAERISAWPIREWDSSLMEPVVAHRDGHGLHLDKTPSPTAFTPDAVFFSGPDWDCVLTIRATDQVVKYRIIGQDRQRGHLIGVRLSDD